MSEPILSIMPVRQWEEMTLRGQWAKFDEEIHEVWKETDKQAEAIELLDTIQALTGVLVIHCKTYGLDMQEIIKLHDAKNVARGYQEER